MWFKQHFASNVRATNLILKTEMWLSHTSKLIDHSQSLLWFAYSENLNHEGQFSVWWDHTVAPETTASGASFAIRKFWCNLYDSFSTNPHSAKPGRGVAQ